MKHFNYESRSLRRIQEIIFIKSLEPFTKYTNKEVLSYTFIGGILLTAIREKTLQKILNRINLKIVDFNGHRFGGCSW